MDPVGKLYKGTWDALDYMFNFIFIAELFMNMYQYGGPKKRFWRSPWNCFDTFIVSASILLDRRGQPTILPQEAQAAARLPRLPPLQAHQEPQPDPHRAHRLHPWRRQRVRAHDHLLLHLRHPR